MTQTVEFNFAGRLVERLGGHSYMVDAATGETISPADLRALIIGFADLFLKAGLSTGERILIGCSLSPASAVAYLGAMYAGLVPVPVELQVLATTGEGLWTKTNARAVWTEEDFSLDWLKRFGLPQLTGSPIRSLSLTLPPAARVANDLASLMLTSGSTGIPRLVMVSHGNLIANTEAIIHSQHLGKDERAMLILPVNYCFGASVLHTHLYQGGGVVFDRRFMFPDKVLRAIAATGCTTFAGVPTVYNILLRRSNLRSIAMPRLRRFLQAGGALATEQIKELRRIVLPADLYVMYGQTEATARITCLEPERLEQKMGSVGRPLDNLNLRIVDEQGNDLPTGVTGEILVQGPSVCSGYLDDPAESQRVFQAGWLHTGDLGHFDAEYYLWIQGRKSQFIKMRGVRVSYAEAEARVLRVPGVSECAATAVAHEEAGEALALFVVCEPGAQQVTENVRRQLPPHWTCVSITEVPQLPKTSTGKIARALLKVS